MNTCLFSVFVLFAFVCFLRVYVRMPAINHVFVKLVGFLRRWDLNCIHGYIPISIMSFLR